MPKYLKSTMKLTTTAEGSTNEQLAHVDLNYIRETYKYPHMVGHRSNLATSIYEGCKREKAVNFFFATAIDAVNSFGPTPSFKAISRKGGEPYTVECDVLLSADGIKYDVRDQLLKQTGVDAKIVDTGQAAYRIMLRRDEMEHDPELLELIDSEAVTRWIGEKRHIIAYPISNKTIYNLSTVQPDRNFAEAPSATYTTRGSKAQMMETFGDFSPMVLRMLDLVKDGEVCEWKLRVHEPLPSWTHEQTALVGDACHPTLPHMAQGAAQAIEDGAVLGVVLSKLPDTSPESVRKALKVYQDVRMDRAYRLVELAAANGRAMHLGDGAAKEERDRQFAALKEKKGGAVPDKWADADVQRMTYGEDIAKTAEEKFEEFFARA